MSGILCAWANLPEEWAEWYSEEYLQRQRSLDCIHSIHCEVTASGMENEPVGKLDAPWPYLTVYEIEDVKWAQKQVTDASMDLPEEAKSGPLKHVRFDVRTYREVKRWQDENWEGMGGDDIEHVASIAAMEWAVAADKEEEVLKFYQEKVGPTIASSPDVLRFRLFKIEYAATMDTDQKLVVNETERLHKYFTLVELEAEEWPWDVVVDLAEEQGWKDYFETQAVVKWQLSHYLVNKTFPPQKQGVSNS